MKKRMYIPMLLAMFLLVGCGKPTANEYDPERTVNALLDSAAFSETLEVLDLDIACMLYRLEETDVKDGLVYASTGASAEEIAVLRLKDEDTAKAAISLLEARVAEQRASYEGYGPAEVPKLDSAILEQRGTTVLLVVCSDAAAAQRALGSLD